MPDRAKRICSHIAGRGQHQQTARYRVEFLCPACEPLINNPVIKKKTAPAGMSEYDVLVHRENLKCNVTESEIIASIMLYALGAGVIMRKHPQSGRDYGHKWRRLGGNFVRLPSGARY